MSFLYKIILEMPIKIKQKLSFLSKYFKFTWESMPKMFNTIEKYSTISKQ